MAKRHRSPAYPSSTLTDSVQRAKQFFGKEGKHPAPVLVAVTHWGYAPKSSGGLLTISALKAYGLMKDEGSGKERVIRLSQRGLDIVRDDREDSPERDSLLKEAALTPKIIRDLVDEYPDGGASAETLKYFLVKREFNPNAVSDVLKVYDDAKSYLILDAESNSEDSDGEPETSIGKPADVEGKEERKAPVIIKDDVVAATNALKVLTPGGSMRQETFALDTGDVTIQWPSKMTVESYQDFSDWLDILKRKVKRNVEADKLESEPLRLI